MFYLDIVGLKVNGGKVCVNLYVCLWMKRWWGGGGSIV